MLTIPAITATRPRMRADVVSLIWRVFEVKVDDIQTVPTSLDHLNHLRLNEVSPLEHLMATFDQFVSSIRQEFGEQDAGKKFEVFCKWFLENDPEWSKKVDRVWLWDEYPNKWQ